MHSLKGLAAPPALAALSEPVSQHTRPTRSSFMDCGFLAGLFLQALMEAWPWKQGLGPTCPVWCLLKYVQGGHCPTS